MCCGSSLRAYNEREGETIIVVFTYQAKQIVQTKSFARISQMVNISKH